MANLDNSRGFQLYQTGSHAEPRTAWLRVKASTIVYPNQPLKLVAAGVASGTEVVVEPITAAADVVYAISQGYVSAAASGVYRVLAITDVQNHLWRTQTDGALAGTDMGKFGAMTATAASTSPAQARNFITYSTLAAAPGDISDGTLWEILGLVPEGGNVLGAYADIIVAYRYTRQPAA